MLAAPLLVITWTCRLARVLPAIVPHSDSDGGSLADRGLLPVGSSAAAALLTLGAAAGLRMVYFSCLLLPSSRANRVVARLGAPTHLAAGVLKTGVIPSNLRTPTLTVCSSRGHRQPSVTHSIEMVEIFTSAWAAWLSGLA